MNYGNIPDEVLGIKLNTVEDEILSLAEMIGQTTSEDIQHARWVVTNLSVNELSLLSFTAWTENTVLTLACTSFGYHLISLERNY